jgi:hypothetical protein
LATKQRVQEEIKNISHNETTYITVVVNGKGLFEGEFEC